MCWPVPARAAQYVPYPTHTLRHTPLPAFWATKEASRPGMGLLRPIKPWPPGETTQFEAGKGGNFTGRNGAAERASHEDISTIFLPASLMPHSHRLPPFSTLITTVLFPPLRFFAIW